jgi:hypothetical protein
MDNHSHHPPNHPAGSNKISMSPIAQQQSLLPSPSPISSSSGFPPYMQQPQTKMEIFSPPSQSPQASTLPLNHPSTQTNSYNPSVYSKVPNNSPNPSAVAAAAANINATFGSLVNVNTSGLPPSVTPTSSSSQSSLMNLMNSDVNSNSSNFYLNMMGMDDRPVEDDWINSIIEGDYKVSPSRDRSNCPNQIGVT